MKTTFKMLKTIIDKKVANIVKDKESDEGFTIVFDDDTRLEVGYSKNNGATFLNNKKVMFKE